MQEAQARDAEGDFHKVFFKTLSLVARNPKFTG
jgi:hypothetical protein